MKGRKLYIISVVLLLISILFLIVTSYLAFLFIAHKFDTDFLRIEMCHNDGGIWNEEIRTCVRE
jgi:hypothetical protein